jgi:hypothetical protein
MAPLSYCQLVRIGREKRLLVAIDSAQEISNQLRVGGEPLRTPG